MAFQVTIMVTMLGFTKAVVSETCSLRPQHQWDFVTKWKPFRDDWVMREKSIFTLFTKPRKLPCEDISDIILNHI